MHKLLWLLIAILLALPAAEGEAKKPKSDGDGGNINVPGERPFDEVNIFGDLGKIFRLPNTDENKIWWDAWYAGRSEKIASLFFAR